MNRLWSVAVALTLRMGMGREREGERDTLLCSVLLFPQFARSHFSCDECTTLIETACFLAIIHQLTNCLCSAHCQPGFTIFFFSCSKHLMLCVTCFACAYCLIKPFCLTPSLFLFLLPCVHPQVLQGTTMQQLQQVQVAQSQATPITVNYPDPKLHPFMPLM